MANGFGAAKYGVNIYGQAAYVDAIAVVNAVSSVLPYAGIITPAYATISAASVSTASGQRAALGSAQIDAISTSSSISQRLALGDIVISAVSTSTAAADIVSKGYGTGKYGDNIYGKTAEEDPSILISSVSGLSATGLRVAQGSVQVDSLSAITSIASAIIKGDIFIEVASSVTPTGNVDSLSSCSISAASFSAASARYKYEKLPVASSIWTKL